MDIDDSRPISSNAKGMYDFGDETGADAAETVDTRALSVRIGDKVNVGLQFMHLVVNREIKMALFGDRIGKRDFKRMKTSNANAALRWMGIALHLMNMPHGSQKLLEMQMLVCY